MKVEEEDEDDDDDEDDDEWVRLRCSGCEPVQFNNVVC